jgi:hypothetical protein
MPYRSYNRSYNRRRSSRPTNRVIRASTVTTTVNSTITAYMFTATDPCTATKFKLDIGTGTVEGNMAYALVYVPEGYNANNINLPAVTEDLYNPTMNVLISGVITDPTKGEDHKSSRYSRKMKPGDRICLLLYQTIANSSATYEISFTTVH